jgi:hypothetical protein
MAEIVSPEAEDADRKTPEREELLSFHGLERREWCSMWVAEEWIG